MLIGLVGLSGGLVGCPSNQQVCPTPLLPGNLTPDDLDNLQCCNALKLCCAEMEEGEDKERCEDTVGEGAIVTCQAEYHSNISFERCKPIYVRDHPELTPKPPLTDEPISDAGDSGGG